MGKLGEESRSIRSQLTRIVMIPSVTFVVLFSVLSAATLIQAVSLKMAALDGQDAIGLYRAQTQLQAERRAAVEYLAEPGEAALSGFREQSRETERVLAQVRENAETLAGRGDVTVRSRAAALLESWDTRAEVRTSVVEHGIDRPTALDLYGQVIEAGNRLFEAAGRTLDDGASVAEGTLAGDVMRTQDTFAQADALLSGAVVAGEFTPEEQIEFAGLLEQTRRDLAARAQSMREMPAGRYAELVESEEWARLGALADEVAERELVVAPEPAVSEEDEEEAAAEEAAADPAVPFSAEEWRRAADPVDAGLVELIGEQWDIVVHAADGAGNRLLTWSIGGGIIALFAGALAFGVASRSSHRLIRRLLRLREETLNQAQQELPRIVQRLEHGESVNVADELRQLDHGGDEIGQVASAFNTAQRTAVAAAVRQAEIREGANRVFLAIAHRNQSLVQRQLELLDRVERQEDDPELLDDLFQLDHLATRGRRHAENLIILGGGRPGRRWRHPIPLTDVLRGAVSETEEYARVQLRSVPELSLRGSAVADVIHLIAELVENATAFSPPHTTVQIHAETVPKGLVIEVEDQGLGMNEEDLAAANDTLSRAPEFDVMALTEDSRLGLFVVARLARKHDVGVELRPSPYGGVRAVVLIPPALAVGGATPSLPARAGEHGDGDAWPAEGWEAAEISESAAALPRRSASGDPETVPTPVVHAEEVAPESVRSQAETGGGNGPRPSLPKRSRQSSLVPQLREEPAGELLRPSSRAPEDVGRAMSSMQSATRIARENGDAQGAARTDRTFHENTRSGGDD